MSTINRNLRRSIRRFRVPLARGAIIVFMGAMISACAQHAPVLDRVPQTTVTDKLSETDLSARGSRHVGRRPASVDGSDGSIRSERLYPGTDAMVVRQPTAANFSGIKTAGDGYELNFNNVNLADAVKAILGDTLRKPYVFDPRLQGQVTLSTGRPVSEEELLSILEVVLQLNNAALMIADGKYQVAPSSLATNGTKRLIGLTAPGTQQRPGYGVSVLPLRHISAKQMLSLIDGFLTSSGSVRADVTRNLLLLRGSAPERRTLLDVATSFDLDWLKGQAAGIFPLKFATAEEVVPELQKILDTEKGGRGNGTVKFEPIKRLNAVLVLAQRNETLQAVASWIKRLDRSNSDGVNVYVYTVEHLKADPLAAILNATFGPSTGGAAPDIAPDENRSTLESGDNGSFNKNPDAGSGTGRRPGVAGSAVAGSGVATSDEKVSDIKTASVAVQPKSSDRPGDVRIVPDRSNNTLLIRARPRDYRRVLAALRGLDRPPLQILINATIAEVTLNDNLRYGVQFFLKGKSATVDVADVTGLPLQQAFPGLNFVLGSLGSPRLVLDALANVTKVQVVSSPSVVVLDSQVAKLKVGAEVPVLTQQSTSLNTADTRVVNAVVFRDTGVILKVIPRVSSSGLVTMEVQQEISAVSPSSAPGSLTPTINQRQINSTIAVYSGQTVLLGGLISEGDSREKDRVPLVQSIPLLGELIGSTNKERNRTELIVFIRPQVIRDGHDASMAAQELVNRLQLVQPVRERGGRWSPERRSSRKD